MKIQNLILLGILKESPKHGYEIKKILAEKIGIYTAAENKSIYYPLKIMERKGLISKSVAAGHGKLLRYVYSITPRGEKEFNRLALEALLSQKRPFIDIDIPLYFLPHLDAHQVLARLRLRKRFLERVRSWLTQNLKNHQTSVHRSLLLRHHLNLLSTEEAFVGEIIRILKK